MKLKFSNRYYQFEMVKLKFLNWHYYQFKTVKLNFLIAIIHLNERKYIVTIVMHLQACKYTL